MVEPEVYREVVAGAGEDHQERYPVLGRDGADQRLSAVPARHAHQVAPVADRLAGHVGDVDTGRCVEQEHVDAQCPRTALRIEQLYLAATNHGLMIRNGRRGGGVACPTARVGFRADKSRPTEADARALALIVREAVPPDASRLACAEEAGSARSGRA